MSVVTPRIYRAMLTVNVSMLSECSDAELRPVLPSLVRMSLIASLDKSSLCTSHKSKLLEILSRIDLVNNIVALLSIDFHALETDVRKEQMLRGKVTGSHESFLSVTSEHGPAIDFERSDATRRLRLVLSQLLAIMNNERKKINKEHVTSELFDHVMYLPEICDVLSIAMAELPNLLSASEVAEALYPYKYGSNIICHIVANQPDCFIEIVSSLLKNGDKIEEDSLRLQSLLALCRINPSEMFSIRNQCIEWCRMPSLAIFLTLEREENDDLVAFLTGLLLGSDPNVRNWISLFIRNKKKDVEAIQAFRTRLVGKLKNLISSKLVVANSLVQASNLIRLYTALRGIAGLKFTDEETELLMDLISIRVPSSPPGVNFVSLALSMIIAVNSLIGSPPLERRASEWIRWLAEEFESSNGNVEELLLLLAIHFHAQQLTAVSDLACTTLDMKIAIRTNSLHKIKQIFTQDIFTENVVAAHAVKVPVTDKLSAKNMGFLPVHCIHQLLKSRAFSKHKVPIKEWIYKQVIVSTTPLHPLLPSLIEVYVNSILVPANNRNQSLEQTNEPLSESEIRRIFDGKNLCDFSTPHILLLYYTLLYEHVRLSQLKSLTLGGNRRVLRYSRTLLSELPIKYLLNAVERDKQNKFGGIFPQLLKLCVTHYPHLCSVHDWLNENEGSSVSRVAKGSYPTEKMIYKVFSEFHDCFPRVTLCFQKLLEMSPQSLWPLSNVLISHMSVLLHHEIPRNIKDLYKKLWYRMNTTYPRKLWVLTVNALRNDFKPITQDDLIIDPLHVLRVDSRVFRSAPILEIFLYLLKACLAASRSYYSQHIQNHPIMDRSFSSSSILLPNNNTMTSNISNTDQEREELNNALLTTQESAAIQILLESGLEDENEEKDSHYLSDVKESQSLICSYFHEAFINDPHLAKLVHFQGYPLEMLPVVVASVPSMHICLDFAPELLSQPDLEKQMFAIHLISHLSIHYALPKSYSIARLAVNTLSTFLSVLTTEERRILYPPTLPALSRITKAFPPLTEDVVSLLFQYGRICLSESCMSDTFTPNTFESDDEFSKESSPSKILFNIQKTFADILKNSICHNRVF